MAAARPGSSAELLLHDPVKIVLPPGIRRRGTEGRAVPLAELAGEAWATGHERMGWEEMTQRACRQHGGFEPDIRHRTNDAVVTLAIVARGLAVTLLPDLVLAGRPPGVVVRAPVEGDPVGRSVYAVTRAADAARPSVRALVAAMADAVGAL